MSLEGVWPLARTLDHGGPIATSVEDLALLYEVLAGPLEISPRRASAPAPTCTSSRSSRTSRRRSTPRPDGAVEVALPEAGLFLDAFRTIQFAEGHATHSAAGLYPARAEEYGADVRGRIETGSGVTLPELLAAHAAREAVRAGFTRVFDEVDVLITPAVPARRR